MFLYLLIVYQGFPTSEVVYVLCQAFVEMLNIIMMEVVLFICLYGVTCVYMI